jgi:crossover junction endodeoxyribonuclease RuvC
VKPAFGLIVREFTPLEIKIAITGYGRADKKQMINMVPRLIALKKEILLDDEFDAIAAALTYMATRNSIR